jgi:hypothetical protein
MTPLLVFIIILSLAASFCVGYLVGAWAERKIIDGEDE